MIKLRRAVLLPALLKVSKVINNRGRNEVLKNLKIAVTGNQLHMSATNGEQLVTASVDCEADKSFTAIIHAKSFERIVRKFAKTSTIFLEPSEVSLGIKSEQLFFNAETFPEEKYPVAPDLKNWTCKFLINQDILEQITKQVLFAAGIEEIRYYLNGIHLHSDPDDAKQLVAVATDGKRLAKTMLNIGHTVNLEPITVPRSFFQLLKSGFFDAKQPIEVSVRQTFIRMRQESREIVSKLIESKYPNYQRVFPTENNDYFRVNRQALINEINNVCAVFDNKKEMPLSVNFSTGGVTLEAHNGAFGSALADAPVIASNSTEDGVVTGFNGRFLLDILAASDAEEVIFRLDAQYPYGAAIIENYPSEEETTFLLMPRRIR